MKGRLFEELAPLSGRRGGVDVDRMTSPRNSVGKVDGMEILLARERVETPDAARLAHAGLRGGSEQRGVAEGRHVTAKQFGEEVDVFVQQALRGRRLAVVGHIGLRARHVDEHHPQASARRSTTARRRGVPPPARAAASSASRMARLVVVDTLPAVAQHRQRVGIYAAEHEDERGRLQRRTCGLHRDARPQRQVGVARGVDEVTGDERLGAVLVLDDDVRDPPLLRPAAGQVGVKIERHACFEQHPLGDELVLLGREGDIAQRLLLLGASDSGEPFDELPRDGRRRCGGRCS